MVISYTCFIYLENYVILISILSGLTCNANRAKTIRQNIVNVMTSANCLTAFNSALMIVFRPIMCKDKLELIRLIYNHYVFDIRIICVSINIFKTITKSKAKYHSSTNILYYEIYQALYRNRYKARICCANKSNIPINSFFFIF